MWQWIKVPKIGALVAFFLPWMTISCSGTPLARATGWQLAFGGYSVATPQGSQPAHEINLWLILAIVAVAVGIWRTFLAQSKKEALNVAVSSAIAVVLIWIGTARYSKSALLAEASKRANDGLSGSVDQAASMMIQVTWEIGYWIAILALIAAGVMAWLTYSGKDASVQESIRNAADVAAAPPSDGSVSEDAGPTISG